MSLLKSKNKIFLRECISLKSILVQKQFIAVLLKYGFLLSIFRNKLKNKYSNHKLGRLTILGEQEENELLELIFDAIKQGFLITKFELIETVENICVRFKIPNLFINNTPGRKRYN